MESLLRFSLGKEGEIILTFLQQLLFPQQFVKMELAIASDGDGDGGFEVEDGANLLGAPLKGRSISTNSRSCKIQQKYYEKTWLAG